MSYKIYIKTNISFYNEGLVILQDITEYIRL